MLLFPIGSLPNSAGAWATIALDVYGDMIVLAARSRTIAP